MIGRVLKYKYPYTSILTYNSLQIFKLKEDHDAGEIIYGNYLILNNDAPWSDEFIYKYKKDEYVKIIHIGACDVFETDINYSDRDDLILYGYISIIIDNQCIKIYKYAYVG